MGWCDHRERSAAMRRGRHGKTSPHRAGAKSGAAREARARRRPPSAACRGARRPASRLRRGKLPPCRGRLPSRLPVPVTHGCLAVAPEAARRPPQRRAAPPRAHRPSSARSTPGLPPGGSSPKLSAMSASLPGGRTTAVIRARHAPSTFSRMPPTGSTLPASVSSPLMATSTGAAWPVSAETRATASAPPPTRRPSTGRLRPGARARPSSRPT